MRAECRAELANNIADWLAMDEDLISIRSKIPVPRQLDDISTGKKRVVKTINMILTPFLIIFAGLSYWQFRRILRNIKK